MSLPPHLDHKRFKYCHIETPKIQQLCDLIELDPDLNNEQKIDEFHLIGYSTIYDLIGFDYCVCHFPIYSPQKYTLTEIYKPKNSELPSIYKIYYPPLSFY